MTNLKNIIFYVDFNLPDIDWVHELSPPNQNSTSFLFMECLRD